MQGLTVETAMKQRGPGSSITRIVGGITLAGLITALAGVGTCAASQELADRWADVLALMTLGGAGVFLIGAVVLTIASVFRR
jgi:hypothetical protein